MRHLRYKSSASRRFYHCVKSVRIRSYSGPHFSAFGCGKMRTRITPNTDTFYTVYVMLNSLLTPEFWSVKWMATTPPKAEIVKVLYIKFKKIQKKTKIPRIVSVQDRSYIIFRTCNSNHTAVYIDKKWGTKYFILLFLQLWRVIWQLPTILRLEL